MTWLGLDPRLDPIPAFLRRIGVTRFPIERCRKPRFRLLNALLEDDRKAALDRAGSTPAANANGPRLVVDNDVLT